MLKLKTYMYVILGCYLLAGLVAISASQDPVDQADGQSLNTSDVKIPPLDENTIWDRLSGIQSFKAQYTEKKIIKLFHSPLESSGMMFYRKPDELVRICLKPHQEIMTLRSQVLTLHYPDLDSKEAVNLADQPVAHAVINHLIWFFNGDREKISKHFDLSLEQSGNTDILLEMIPKSSPMNKTILSIQIVISPDYLPQSVRITESGGDYSLMSFSDVIFNQPFEELPEWDDLQKYF